jgi:putative sigma-54 modulation protein
MQLRITGKNIDLVAPARRHIERKMAKLGRHLPNITTANLEITGEKTRSAQGRFVAQVTVSSDGTVMRGQEKGDSLLTAGDRLTGVMLGQIEHHKSRLYKKGRGGSPARSGPGRDSAPQSSGGVVKVKRFAVKPMLIEEAIDQMKALGHDFFLFFNDATEEVNLLYRRRDGNYGLIEPEFG